MLVAALLLVNRDLAAENDQIQARDAALQTAVSSIVQPGAERMDMTGEGDARAVARRDERTSVRPGGPGSVSS